MDSPRRTGEDREGTDGGAKGDAETACDPRTTGEYVRRVSYFSEGATGSLTLVGVVHDHPASVYRVRKTVEEVDPDVLALELPPTAVPLFEQYAETERSPPVFGGEMSAAVQTARTEETVGIDGPTRRYLTRLAGCLLRERPSTDTTRKVLSSTFSATRHAIVCRLAASISAVTDLRLEVDSPVPHDIGADETAETQAEDEHRQVRRARAFMDAFRTASRSRATRLVDTVREEHMADRLSELDGVDAEKDVVAVVGIDHLDAVAELLDSNKEE